MNDKLREEFEAAISPHFVMQSPPFNSRMPNGSYFYAHMNLAWTAYQLRVPRYSIVEKDGTVICQCSDEGWAASIQELLDSNHLTVTRIV